MIRSKKKPSKEEIVAFVKFFLLLNFGLICTAVGIAIFKTPNHFAFGGTSGISIILATVFPKINVGVAMWIVNAALVVLGVIFLDIRKTGWTVYSSFALSFYVSVSEKLLPLSEPLTDELFLEFCFAVILPAIGSALVFNIGASTGGTDIIAMILSKHTSLEIGRALLISDIGIVLIAAVIYGPKTGLYCILGMVLKCTVVDGAVESLNLRKICTVISCCPERIKDFVINTLHRSATEQKANGAYTGENRYVIMTVLTRHEAAMLRNYIRKEDPRAFMTIVNSSEIIGKGFRSI